MSDPAPGGGAVAGPARRTPLRVEIAWSAGVGCWWLLVAVVGFWHFLERIRHL